MGWRLKSFPGVGGGFSAWVNDAGKIVKYENDCTLHVHQYDLWRPTINIADAWQVVEKLYKDKGLRMFVGLDFPPLYMARLKDDKGDWIGHGAEAETAPLAICLAALKTVGVEVEVNEQ